MRTRIGNLLSGISLGYLCIVAIFGASIAQSGLAATSTASGTFDTAKNNIDLGSGQLVGRRRHQPITVIKEVDKASPKVATPSVANGRYKGTVTLIKKSDATSASPATNAGTNAP